jgi:hypothetical protein
MAITPPAFDDETGNQHYIAQVVQRLNSADNTHLHSFTIAIHQKSTVCTNPRRVSTKRNFSEQDLYTFYQDENVRRNLEKIYHYYENPYRDNYNLLLDRLQNVSRNTLYHGDEEAVRLCKALFAMRFMEFIRNPFCVIKIRNSMPEKFDNFRPEDPVYAEAFDQILALPAAQVLERAQKFSLSPEHYRLWLSTQIMLLLDENKMSIVDTPGDHRPLLEQISDGLLEDSPCARFQIYLLSESAPHRFLLSDRSMFWDHVPITQEQLSFYINISSRLLLRVDLYTEEDLRGELSTLSPEKIQKEVDHTKSCIPICLIRDNLDWVGWINRTTVMQACNNVCCESDQIYGVKQVVCP